MNLAELLVTACDRQASDMVLAANAPPTVWVDGRMEVMAGVEGPLAVGQVEQLFRPLLSDAQQNQMRQAGDVDWAFSLDEAVRRLEPRLPGERASVSGEAGGAACPCPAASGEVARGLVETSARPASRVRVNLHRQRGDWAAAIRFIPPRPPALESLNLPDVVAGWLDLPRGLVLVTGPAGAGKSTTLAALIQQANETRNYHVITLEDPIEYEFEHGTCLIEQRQIGPDSPSFAGALRHVVRQRPDVILVGELRDRETVAAALTAAETGHLVIGTLHTNSAPATVARVIDAFEQDRQGQIRAQLAGSLQCILCQHLLADRVAGGLIPVTEVLVATTGVRRAIRDGQAHLLVGMLETGQAVGMHSLEQDLARLLDVGRISLDDALGLASEPDKLNRRRQTGGGP